MVTATPEKQATGAENVIWDLSVFYSGFDDPQIEQDIQQLHSMVDEFVSTYKGRVGELDAEEMVDAMKAQEAIFDLGGRLQSFASLNFSTDTGNSQFGAEMQRMSELSSKMQQKLVFFDLEWNQVDDAKAEQLLNDPTLGDYRYHLHAERRYKPHQLTEAEEQILLEKNVTGRSAWTRFFTQLTSSFRFDWDGEELNMSQLLTKLYDTDRSIRERAAQMMTDKLQERSMELSYIFNVLAADKASNDKLRDYSSWISSRNLANKAPDAVVDALGKTVTSNYDIVARHYTLKRQLTGLDELKDYDRYAPLNLKESDAFYTWDEAKAIVLNAFRQFNPQMAEGVERFFDENWIHAPITPGKRGGAFASPTVPSAHPYILVNFNGTARNVMTLAHELGHGIHMLLSGENQTLMGLYTPLTTGEMASVFAEMLVFQDLMAKEDDKEVQLSMLVSKLENVFATVFRQISMNRFEDLMHTARREEGELSTERLNELWLTTQKDMFQDSVEITDNYGYWWSYIHHFLSSPGYVYAYSFGELLVMALYKTYQEKGESFAPKYVELLSAGDSDYPDNLLAKVGVDLNDPNFWQKGIDAIETMVAQEEALARELYPEKFG